MLAPYKFILAIGLLATNKVGRKNMLNLLLQFFNKYLAFNIQGMALLTYCIFQI